VVSEATNSRLQILDLQYLPDSVSLVTTFAYPGFTRAHNISQSGQFLYLSGGNVCPNGGVQILDLINPVSPIVRGFNSDRYVHDCRRFNDSIWAANILNQRVSIINATDKDNLPEIRSFVSLEPMPHNTALSSDRKYLFLTHENQDPPGSLEIWNVEDLENITYVNNWLPTGITTSVTHNIEIFGNLAIIAHYTAGVRILNITDPVNPVEVAWYDTRPQDNDNIFQGCWGVYRFPSGKIIASDISNGLFVIKADIPTDIVSSKEIPQLFKLNQNFPNPFNPATVIGYTLNKNSNVKLRIYDVLGNEVSVLVNEKQKEGNYSVKWNAANYPSGIYFYKIESNGYSETKKMTLIK
jgi:choice-of-anchor B domain-containing protein